ncbi:MAG: hypothetical protein DWQ06_13670 [Calditrichaeota bacterium]|nr:MAG: hypothetical protein DWQ06_13670 [Calditrichota bacterium]
MKIFFLKLIWVVIPLLLVPIALWNEVSIDYGVLVTEYYKFIFDAILLWLIGYYLNSKIENLKLNEKKLIAKTSTTYLVNQILEDLDNINEGNINKLKQNWNRVHDQIKLMNTDIQIFCANNKSHINILQNLTKGNYRYHIKKIEFKKVKEFLQNLSERLAK